MNFVSHLLRKTPLHLYSLALSLASSLTKEWRLRNARPPMKSINLGNKIVLKIHDDLIITDINGIEAHAYIETNYKTLLYALSLDYEGPKCISACKVEEQAFHTLVSRFIYNEESPILLKLAGTSINPPKWREHHEKAIVPALQIYLNTHKVLKPLDPWLITLVEPARMLRKAIGLAPVLPIETKVKAKE